MRLMRKERRNGDRAGFSLLEVLMAVVVVGVGFLAAASMQGTSVGSNNRSAYMTVATYLAEDKIEELRNMNYQLIDAAGSPENGLDELGQVGTGGIFDRSWAVALDSPGVLMKTITVTVTWQERGVNHSLTMTTVIGG